jgi:soluble lytic murein transglycosylase-like protein
MKNILAIAAIVLGVTACNNSGNDVETNADTAAATLGDTANMGTGSGMDTASPYNAGDSTGINRDTSRRDRTDVRRPSDTTTRRRSDSLR